MNKIQSRQRYVVGMNLTALNFCYEGNKNLQIIERLQGQQKYVIHMQTIASTFFCLFLQTYLCAPRIDGVLQKNL